MKILARGSRWKSRLSAIITTTLMAGIWTASASAAVFDVPITGKVKNDTKVLENVDVSEHNGTVTYDFSKVKNADFSSYGLFALGEGKKDSLVLKGADMKIHLDDSGAISIGDQKRVVINGDLDIRAAGSRPWTGTGISIEREGSGEGKRSDLLINGDVTMKGADERQPWGVYTTADNIHGGYEHTDGYKGGRWSPTGISLGNSHGSTITINGMVDMTVKGTGIKTDPYYPSKGIADHDLAVITIKGGTVITPEEKDSYFSLASYGGTINMNMNQELDASAGNDVKLVGNILAIQEKDNSGAPFFYRNGRINLGLDTENSSWKGVIDNAGTDYAGEVNLYLSNGATWYHDSPGNTNSLDALHMPEPSNENHYGVYDNISHLNKFVGGADAAHSGAVIMKHGSAMEIADYAGNGRFFYAHNNAGEETDDYIGGDIRIGKAAENSGIILSTDNKNVNMKDNEAVVKTLNALAGKLEYTAHKNGETNLEGKAEIASGLTASGKTLKLGNMVFDDSGRGTVTELDESAEDKELAAGVFPQQLIMDNYGGEKNREYWAEKGIFREGKNYVFDSDATIDADYGRDGGFKLTGNYGAVMWAGSQDGSIDMQGNKLTLRTTSDGTANSGAAGITNYSAKLDIRNVNGIDIQLKDKYGAKGIVVDGTTSMGQWNNGNGQAFFTIHNDNKKEHAVKIRVEREHPDSMFYNIGIQVHRNTDNSLGIADIKGLVDIELPEGKAHGIDISASGKGLPGSNFDPALDGQFDGAQLSVGGGRIVVKDGFAVRNTHNGVFRLNAENEDGFAKAVNHDNAVQIDGNVINALLAKSNYAFATEDSYLHGLAVNSRTHKGEAAFYMGGGSRWINENTSNYEFEEDTTGNPNAINYTKGSSISSLSSDGGIIIQKDSNPLTIGNFKGRTTIVYGHENKGTTAADYSGLGDTIINHGQDGSKITLFTDSANIDTTDPAEYEKAFDALAHKLYFKGVLDAEYGVTGDLKIASGLTSSAGMIHGAIAFDDGTGQGYYTKKIRPEQTVSRYGKAVTGVESKDTEYVDNGILFTPHNYTFRKDGTVSMTDGKAAVHAEEAVNINANKRNLALATKGNGATMASAVLHDSASGLTIKAGTLKVTADNAGTGGAADIRLDNGAKASVDGATALEASGKDKAYGIYAAGGSKISLDGSLTSGGDGKAGIKAESASAGTESYRDVAGIAAFSGGSATVNATTDMAVAGTGALAEGDGAEITFLNDVALAVDSTGGRQAYAAAAKDGRILINMEDGQHADDHRVALKGNLGLLDGNGVIGLGLAGEDSSWTGIVSNGDGTFNLVVDKNAVWNHERHGAAPDSFNASRVNSLTGSGDSAAAGTVFMRDTADLLVDNFSGNVNAVYAHEGDGTGAEDYKAGSLRIGKAAEHSGITLITDNEGIDMEDEEKVDRALNALAGKLFYKGSTEGEDNLYGRVRIASGLTASAQVKKVGHVSYDATTGQGKVEKKTGVLEAPQILPDESMIGMMKEGLEKATEFYKKHGILDNEGNYEFDQDASITAVEGLRYNSSQIPNIGFVRSGHTISMTGHSLSLHSEVEDPDDEYFAINIYGSSNTKPKTTLVKDVDELTMKAVGTDWDVKAANILAVDGGNIVFDNVRHTTATLENGYFGDAAITVTGFGQKASFTNPGLMDITVHNDGYVGRVHESMKGDESFIRLGGGKFRTDFMDAFKVGAFGQLYINEAGTNDVEIEGSVRLEHEALADISLTTPDSRWKGLVDGTSSSKGTLKLANGAVWENEAKENTAETDDYYMEDYYLVSNQLLDTLKGAKDAEHTGYVLRNSDMPLNISNMDGTVTFVYKHENAGDKAEDYKAGDTVIKSAKSGTTAIVSTDNAGIRMDDKDAVHNTLNALAGKLVYEGYMNGERMLKGKAQIASGLTAGAQSLELKDMSFDRDTGHGYLPDENEPALNSAPVITGDAAKDTWYGDKAMIAEDGSYKITEEVTIESFNGESGIRSDKPLTVDAGDNKLGVDIRKNMSGSFAGVWVDAAGDSSIAARELDITSRNSKARTEGIHVQGKSATDRTRLDVTTDKTTVQVHGSDYALGIYSSGNAELNIHGDLVMRGADGASSGVTNEKPGLGRNSSYYNTSAIYAGSDYNIQKGATVNVEGKADLGVEDGVAVFANGGGSTVNLKGGANLVVPGHSGKGVNYAAIAQNGTVNININDFGDGGNGRDVNIHGNLGLLNGAVNPKEPEKNTVINLAMDTDSSKFTGVIVNDFTLNQLEKGEKPAFNLFLSNGAMWEHTRMSDTVPVFNGSVVESLVGGEDRAHAGTIHQKDVSDIRIKNFKGSVIVAFDHEKPAVVESAVEAPVTRSVASITAAAPTAGATGSGETATVPVKSPKILGGDVIFENVTGANSEIRATTDPDGIDMQNDAVVKQVLTDTAAKIFVKKGDENVNGRVQIASGLTSSTKALKLSEMNFDSPDKHGILGEELDPDKDKTTPVSGNVFDEDYESMIMKGVRSAMMNMAMRWRGVAATDYDHMVHARETGAEGPWAHVYRSKTSYDGAGTEFNSSYSGVEVGYDRQLGDGWTAGVSLDYEDGKDTYVKTGSGKYHVITGGVYATKDMQDGAYLDLAAKAGTLKDSFKVSNEILTTTVEGDYKSVGYALGAGVGKRIGMKHGLYVEPKASLTYSHLDGADYEATADTRKLTVSADAVDSLVGRMGLTLGQTGDKGGVYAKATLAHDFTGKVKGTYDSADGGEKTTEFDIKDTWVELGLGAKYSLNKDLDFNAEVSKSFGSDYRADWKVNAGLQYRFNWGGRKAPAAGMEAQNGTETGRSGNTSAAMAPQSGMASGNIAGGNASPREERSWGRDVEESTAKLRAAAAVNSASEVSAPVAVSGYKAEDGPEFMLAPIVVTASRTAQTIADAKADISVVTRKQIEDFHMNTVEDALRTVPGVQFLNYGSGGINANLSGVRINGSKDILVLVDGVRMTAFQGSNNGGYFYASMLKNMDNIERIEVLRGSAGALYGSDAKGGVINIITRDPGRPKTTVDYSAGSFGQVKHQFFTQGKTGDAGYKAYYDRTVGGDMHDGDGNVWPMENKSIGKGVELTYDVTPKQKLSFTMNEMESQYAGRDFIYNNDYNGEYSDRNFSVRHIAELGDEWTNSLTYRRNKQETEYTQKEDGQLVYTTGAGYTYDFLSEQASWETDANLLVFGVDYMKGKRDYGTMIGGATGENSEAGKVNPSISNKSFYVQDTWKVVPELAITAGIRRDDPDVSNFVGGKNTKNFKVSYDFSEDMSVYASSSDYYVLPSMSQLYNSKYGNEKLRPAEGRTKSIGITQQVGDLGLVTMNWFKTKEKTGVGFSRNGSFLNTADGIARGWNLQWLAKLGPRVEGTLGWAHLYQHAEGDNYSRGYYPKNLFSFALNYEYEKWNVGLDGFYFMRSQSTDANDADKKGWPHDNYGIYNLSLNYSPVKDITIYGQVNNIFDTLWAEHTDVIHSGKPGTWYAMPGRSFNLGVNYRF